MSKGYEVPSWGAKPTDNFSFEVLKNGSVLENIVLSGKDHFIVGRQPDACDITLEHPSISRVHAVLQYRDDGALMILDMKSAHGTFVNKTAMTEGVYQRLYVGDFVRFGASSRSYIVGGPDSHRLDEYDSANMRVYRQKLVERTSVVEEQKRREEELGVGWGFGEDAVNYDEDENDEEEEELPDYVKNDPNYQRIYGEKFSSTLRSEEVSDKDAKVFEKIRKKEKKIQNMQEEIKRIYMKEGKQDEGLTSGQAAAVERNDKRIEVLKGEVEAMVNTLRGKNLQREGTAKNKEAERSATSKAVTRRDTERDDYESAALDMTADTADLSTNWRLRKKLKQKGLLGMDDRPTSTLFGSGQAVSYEELCEQRNNHADTLDAVLVRLREAEDAISSGEGKGSAAEDGVDVYLTQSKREEAARLKERLDAEKNAVAIELKRIERLMKIAAPDISSLSTVRARNTTTRPDTMPAVGNFPSPGSISVSGRESITTDTNTGPSDVKSCAFTSAVELTEGTLQGHEVAAEPSPMQRDACSEEDAIPRGVIEDARKTQQPEKRLQAVHLGGVGSLVDSIQWSKPGDSSDDEAEVGLPVVSGEKRRGDRGGGGGRKKPRADDDDRGGSQGTNSNGPSGPIVKGPQRPSRSTVVVEGSYGGDYLEGGDRVWAPPKNQTGDGRTALNAKYGY